MRWTGLKCYFVLAAAFLAILSAHAEVTLPGVLASHMVVQRGLPVHVWGDAALGERVTVTFRGHEGSVVADSLGHWSVYLPPGGEGGPFNLTIRGKNVITLTDVLVGDVWIASGQSNMEMPLEKTSFWRGVTHFKDEIAAASYPRLRLFQVEHVASSYPMPDVTAKSWVACTPESVAGSSAAAYFFGRELVETQHVPIGLIESDWGGTTAEAWTSLRAISSDSSLMPVYAAQANLERYKEATGLKLEPEQGKAGAGSPDFRAPAVLFNGMISPLTRFPIRGVIWCQGASNTDPTRASLYSRLFPALIQDWRRQWGQGNFPFLFVQLANYKGKPGQVVVTVDTDNWPIVREAQLDALSLVNTGMAVAIDIGDPGNIHPRDKLDVGHRLALWARALSYGEHIEDSGPLFRQAAPEGHAMRVWFDHVTGGLVARGNELHSFEVAGADGRFVPAEARVDGNTVLASATSVENPAYVRYGWLADPDCNLYNGAGLPASPFTSQR